MFKKKCSLCGGNLVGGKCVECGLDNNKKSNAGTSNTIAGWNKSSDAFGDVMNNDKFFENIRKEQEEMEVEDVYHRAPDPVFPKPPKNRPSAKPNQPRKKPTQFNRTVFERTSQGRGTSSNEEIEQRKRKVVFMVVGLILFFNIILPLFIGVISFLITGINTAVSGFSNFGSEYEVESQEEYADAVDMSGLQNEDLALTAEGETFDVTLMDGVYIVGVHIPEGTYDITNIYTGNLNIDDDEHGVNEYAYFYDENIGVEICGVYLHEGAEISVEDGAWFQFTTENGNVDGMEGMINPNTEEFEVSGVSVAGVDFPAGVYNLKVPEDCGVIVSLYLSEESYEDESDLLFIKFMCNREYYEEGEQSTSYSNLVIPEGAVLYVEDDEEMNYISLTPSAIIADEDYEAPYEYYYSY